MVKKEEVCGNIFELIRKGVFAYADVQTDDGTQKCDIFYDSIYETCYVLLNAYSSCVYSFRTGAPRTTRWLSRSSIPTRYFIADDAWSTSKTARTRYPTRQRIVAFDPPIEHHFWGSNPCFLAFAPTLSAYEVNRYQGQQTKLGANRQRLVVIRVS